MRIWIVAWIRIELNSGSEYSDTVYPDPQPWSRDNRMYDTVPDVLMFNKLIFVTFESPGTYLTTCSSMKCRSLKALNYLFTQLIAGSGSIQKCMDPDPRSQQPL
jgi:hypothetical protein